MSLAPGTRLGPYEITAAIGAGGMGEVYRARDTRLDRDVAIKVLPEELAADSERLARFKREARTASALDHPNIVTIHDIAEEDGVHFIVMQFVAGKTLRALIGGLRLKEAVGYGVQVAEGLAAAHAQGIVHRDLKPENVIVQENGTVKILDFGLAKLTEPEQPDDVPTRTKGEHLTREGQVMGTAAYMSPEQAEGQVVDARSDIFSFGSMLYEMATGQRAFPGKNTSSILAAILRDEPKPLGELVPVIASELDRLIWRALRKEPDRRWQSMADVRVALGEVKQELESGVALSGARLPAAVAERGRWRRGVAAGAITASVVAVGLWAYLSREVSAPPPSITPLTSDQVPKGAPALSPNGDLLAFTKRGEAGTWDLYVHQVDGGVPRAIHQGSGDVYAPAWSPDSQYIAFVRHAGGDLKRILKVPALSGGDERPLGEFTGRDALAWSPDGKFLAIARRETPEAPSSIYLLSLDTEDQDRLTTPPAEYVVGDYYPRFSPNGQTVAFVRAIGQGATDIWTVPVSGRNRGKATRLTSGNGNTMGLDWAPDGQSVVFSAYRSGQASPWSLWRVSASGGEPESSWVGEQGTYPTVSRKSGRLAYLDLDINWNIWRVGGPSAAREERDAPVELITSSWMNYFPRYSPDGRRIAFTSSRIGSQEIWIFDSDGRDPKRFTFLEDPMTKNASWSPDGQSIVFDSPKKGSNDVYVMSLTEGIPRPRTTDPESESSAHFSEDGSSVYFSSNRTGRRELWKMPAAGGKAVQVTQNGGTASWVSPGGQFLYFVKGANWGPLWQIPVGGGAEVEVLPDVHRSYVSVFDKGVCYVPRSARPAIDCLDFATGQVTRVADLPDQSLGIGLSVSRDGRWILYVRIAKHEEDIMLVENFR